MKSWFKENMDVGDVITLVSGFVILLFIISAFYYMTINRISNLEDQYTRLDNKLVIVGQQIKTSTKRWNDIIKQLDKRYVDQQQFDDYKRETNRRLTDISADIKYLIRLEIGSRGNGSLQISVTTLTQDSLHGFSSPIGLADNLRLYE